MGQNNKTENFVATGIYGGGNYHSELGFDSVYCEIVRNLLEVQL